MYGGPPQQHGGWPPPQGQGFPPHMQQQQYHSGSPGHYPPQGPRHAGLGSHGAAPNLPRTPNFAPAQMSPPNIGGGGGFPGVAPSAGWNGDKFSLFVGNIADGVSDAWLERIVGTAGTVLNLRRPTPAFGFVEYGDPESVLRCLEVVNGVVLKGKNGQEKALLIKADQKERDRLDEYEKSRVKSESTDEYKLQAQDDLRQIVDRLNAGGELDSMNQGGPGGRDTHDKNNVPAHLKDLDAEELPENQRKVILSEIDMFRERSVKKAAERAAQDEARRAAPSQPSYNQAQQNRGWSARAPPPSGQSPSTSAAAAADPQSYNKPIDFVATGAPSNGAQSLNADGRSVPAALPEIDDAERERERAERAAREAEHIFRDRERRYEGRERARISAFERERARERQQADQEERDREIMTERLANFDDDREAEKGREQFYTDRLRWRAQRRQFRQREQEADERDRRLEEQQLAAVSQASEAFLAQQEEMFAGMGKGELKIGGEEGGPAVKLSFASAAASKAKPVSAHPRAPVLLSGDDDEDGKKKRALIPLTYSDDEDDESTTTPAQRRRKIEAKVPKEKDKLFALPLEWTALNEDVLKRKIVPFTTNLIVEYLGSEEEELLNAVTGHIRSRKPASELVEELEPVLDEDATAFVTKVWWQTHVEARAAKKKID